MLFTFVLSRSYLLVNSKKLPKTHADIQSLVLNDLAHNLDLRSAYAGLDEPLTNLTKGFVGYLVFIYLLVHLP